MANDCFKHCIIANIGTYNIMCICDHRNNNNTTY